MHYEKIRITNDFVLRNNFVHGSRISLCGKLTHIEHLDLRGTLTEGYLDNITNLNIVGCLGRS